MLSAFGDESADEKEQYVFAVGGVVAQRGEWDELKLAWDERNQGFPTFHAANCESAREEYKGLDVGACKELYADLVRLLAEAKGLLGFASAVSLPDYRKAFPELPMDLPYFLCFSRVLNHFTEVSFLSVPQEVAEVTFDHSRHEYNATELCRLIAEDSEWRFFGHFDGDVRFSCRKNSSELQVADLIAREGMKHLYNQIGPDKRGTRRSINALADTKRFKFEFMQHVALSGLKSKADALHSENTDYRGWLEMRGLVDNLSNRLKYLWVLRHEGFTP